MKGRQVPQTIGIIVDGGGDWGGDGGEERKGRGMRRTAAQSEGHVSLHNLALLINPSLHGGALEDEMLRFSWFS